MAQNFSEILYTITANRQSVFIIIINCGDAFVEKQWCWCGFARFLLKMTSNGRPISEFDTSLSGYWVLVCTLSRVVYASWNTTVASWSGSLLQSRQVKGIKRREREPQYPSGLRTHDVDLGHMTWTSWWSKQELKSGFWLVQYTRRC